MKWLGAGAVMLASFLFAAARTKEKKQEMICLREVCASLDRLHAELAAALVPMPTLIVGLTEDAKGDAASFFRQIGISLDEKRECTFREIWRESAEQHLRRLDPTDYRAVADLGEWLGRFPLDEQLAALERCTFSLRGSLKRHREHFPEEKRLSYGISLALGGFFSVMLL